MSATLDEDRKPSTMKNSTETLDHVKMENERSISEVRKESNGSRAVVCSFCNKSFKFQSTLRQHEKIHYGIKQHECEVCHRRFLHKGTLKCHLRLHTGETPYQCPHCPKAFRGQTALNCHVFRHTKVGEKCPQCPMIFATSSIVKQHLKQVHTEERSHICNMCGMRYKYLKSLRIHLRNHQKRVCPDCGTGFDSVYTMQRHRKRHFAENRQFKCGFCSRAFDNESELEGHARLRGRSFQCDICCHSFNKQIYLVNHNRRVHWKAMGLERLKVAEPKNGWNRKGVPKVPKKNKMLDGSVNLIEETLLKKPESAQPSALRGEEVQEEDSTTAKDQCSEYIRSEIDETEELTELILLEEKDLEEFENNGMELVANIVDNPLETTHNSKTPSPSQSANQTMNDENVTPAPVDQSQRSLRNRKVETQRPVKIGKEPLICELCGNWYTSATTLSIHRTNHHHVQRYKCDHCERTFGFRCYLEKHVSTHHQNKRIDCALCGKSFKYAQDLKVHMRQHDDSKPFKCDECPSAFRFPSALRSHKILHQEELPFACDVCGKKFRFNNSLRVHLRLHDGIKQFKCDICGRDFSTKAPMLRHMKMHSSSKQLTCNVCDAVFYKKVDLAIHQSREHPNHETIGKGTTIYKCDKCGKEFIKKSNLKAHCYIHEEVYRFQCPLCNQSFKQHAGLRAHLINIHKQTKGANKA